MGENKHFYNEVQICNLHCKGKTNICIALPELPGCNLPCIYFDRMQLHLARMQIALPRCKCKDAEALINLNC